MQDNWWVEGATGGLRVQMSLISHINIEAGLPTSCALFMCIHTDSQIRRIQITLIMSVFGALLNRGM